VLLALVVVASWLLAAPSPVGAQTADDFFDSTTLHDLRLFINTRDYALLRARYQENTFYPADMLWGNMRVRNVGIRSRGTGSRNPVKLGLKIEFDRYTSKQRFLGLASLVLDNLWQDPSLIRERTAMALFARMGQITPREAFVRLFINNVYEGVYTVVEPIDTTFVARVFGETSGYLFEYNWVTPFYGEYLGSAYKPYKAMFDAKGHSGEGDAKIYGPLVDMFREANHEVDPVWRERVESYLDLSQLVTLVAIEGFMAEWDGLTGYAGMNNFYLYRYADTNRHRVLPWDRDLAFLRIDTSAFLRVDENAILRQAMTFPDLRALYLDVLEQCARAAQENDWLLGEIQRVAALITPAVHQDPRKPVTNSQYDDAIAWLQEFGRQRPAVVLEEVARARGGQAAVAAAPDPARDVRIGRRAVARPRAPATAP
jgi:hypothetical protein